MVEPSHTGAQRAAADQPATAIRSFDFATDLSGTITWCEPHVAPMVWGFDLAEFPELGEDFRHRRPIRTATVTLAGASAIAGAWQIDASPHFSAQDNRYLGHIGRFRRPTAAAPTVRSAEAGGADHWPQLLHELRNPINAIQGFAEIIQQQLLGSIPHEYRALAAVIAADAARILAGFGELERLARLAGRSMELVAGESDLGVSIAATVLRLESYTAPRASGFRLAAPCAALPLQLAPIETERLCWRLLATLAGCASPGETLSLELQEDASYARLIMQLPASLATLDDTALLHCLSDARAQTLAVGMFGTGFALRLAATEALAAGGGLERELKTLTLSLPLIGQGAPTPVAETPKAAAGHPMLSDPGHERV